MTAAGSVLMIVSAAVCLAWVVGALIGLRVLRTVPLLEPVVGPAPCLGPTPSHGPMPSLGLAKKGAATADPTGPLLAMVIPAANEAGDAASIEDLRAAHASRLAAAQALVEAASGAPLLDERPTLARIELIYVDDRSTDRTGALLDEIAAETQAGIAVRVLHVRELPEGWLGKTHALQKGVDAAGLQHTPRWMLLTDADVRLTPDALVRALAHAEARGLDHLTLMPHLDQGGLLRDATLAAFGRVFTLGCRLWAVNDPRSSASLGVGAFNLVRGETLRRVGGLRRVRLAVADDMALGQLLRREGARQGVASGRDAVRLAWYRSVREMVRGIEKGIFGYGARCEPWRAFVGAALLLALEVAPWLMLLHGHLAWLGAGALAAGLLTVALGERWMGRRLLPVLLMPLGGLVMIWSIARAGYLGGRRGGVLWRGTFYPSSLLREALSWEGGTRGGRPREG